MKPKEHSIIYFKTELTSFWLWTDDLIRNKGVREWLYMCAIYLVQYFHSECSWLHTHFRNKELYSQYAKDFNLFVILYGVIIPPDEHNTSKICNKSARFSEDLWRDSPEGEGKSGQLSSMYKMYAEFIKFISTSLSLASLHIEMMSSLRSTCARWNPPSPALTWDAFVLRSPKDSSGLPKTFTNLRTRSMVRLRWVPGNENWRSLQGVKNVIESESGVPTGSQRPHLSLQVPLDFTVHFNFLQLRFKSFLFGQRQGTLNHD